MGGWKDSTIRKSWEQKIQREHTKSFSESEIINVNMLNIDLNWQLTDSIHGPDSGLKARKRGIRVAASEKRASGKESEKRWHPWS